jgi:hypothetical protein
VSHGSTIGSARRYYLLKRQAAETLSDNGLAMVWRHKQESEPGEDLPTGFPSLSVLQEAGYSTVEDLTGAGTDELVELGLTQRQAESVLAALAAL